MAIDLVGHGWVGEFLAGHLNHQAIHHAYLFHGAEGMGKGILARRFAQALLCEQGQFPPCLDCHNCQRVERLTHPDYERISSDEVGQTLKIEQVREMQRHIALAPFEGGRRVVLIERAHELSQNAANALLKTLEEPPQHVVLLMTARTLEALPATLVSRCEVVSLRTVSAGEIVEALSAEFGRETASLVGSLAGGRPGKALALARDEETLKRRREALDELQRLLHGDRVSRFRFVGEWTSGRDLAATRRKTLELLESWLSLLRDVMLMANSAQVALSNPDQRERIAMMQSTLSGSQAAAMVRSLKGSMDAISDNGNVQLALEVLLLSLPYLTSR